MRTMLVDEYLAELKAKFGESPRGWKVICPICKTVQTAQDFLDAGVEMDKVSSYFAFSCIGRFTKEKGCDWTLGGLFQLHALELIDSEGKRCPRFEIAKEEG